VTLGTAPSRAERVPRVGNAPHPIQLRGSPLARRALGFLGWQVDFNGLPALQGVMVVYPHTSNWDFIVAILAKWAVGLPLRFWAKDTLFRIPLFGRWLEWVGGVPVVRHAPGGVVTQVVQQVEQARERSELYWLGLSPEGTRKYTEGWRSGFYQVALKAGLPVGVVSLDYGRKVVDATRFMTLSSDPGTDIAQMAAMLQGVRGRHPEMAAPVKFLSVQRTDPHQRKQDHV
jgi:1-acyl-sn-glycerol-3-phosphate acyltransferase